MSFRPYRFTPYAPNRALTITKGAVDGLSSGIQTFAKMKMQRAQMEAHKANAQAMKIYRTAQAEQMRQKSMGSSMSDIRLMNALAKGEHLDPNTLRPLIKDKVDKFLSTARPEEKNAMAAHIEKQIQAGDVPSEIQPYMQFSANQLRSYDRMQGNQTKENVAGTQAGGKVDAANIYGTTRENVARIGAGARVKAAEIGAGSKGGGSNKADLQAMKDLSTEMSGITKNMAALDKPTPMGAMPLGPDEKAALKKGYTDQLIQAHQKYNDIHMRLSTQPGAAQPGAASAPPQDGMGGPKQPRYLKDTNGAAPGDFVQNGKGFFKVGPSGKGYEAGPTGAPAVYAGPEAQRAPQGAPDGVQPPMGQQPQAEAIEAPPVMPAGPPGGDLDIEPVE